MHKHTYEFVPCGLYRGRSKSHLLGCRDSSNLHLLPADGPFDCFGLYGLQRLTENVRCTSHIPSTYHTVVEHTAIAAQHNTALQQQQQQRHGGGGVLFISWFSCVLQKWGPCLAMLRGTAVWKIKGAISNHERALVLYACSSCRCCCCCCVWFVQHKTQAERGLAVLCCVIVRRSEFGASGVVAAAQGVVLPTHAPHTAATTSWRQQQHIAPQNASSSYYTRLATAAHQWILVLSEKVWNFFHFEKCGKRQTEKLRFCASSQRIFSPKAQKKLYW